LTVVSTATVSIHDAPLPTEPMARAALPAAALTKMPRSMALYVAMSMKS
jgi:hypothetical protein